MGLIIGILIAASVGVGANENIGIYVNGKKINADKAFVMDGVTMVPLRLISEALGMSVKWDGDTRSVIINSAPEETRPKLSIQDVTEQILPAVVTVETDESYGTGFFVSPCGKLITCAHVAKDYKTFIITMQNGKKLTARLLEKVDKWDLALLQVSGSNYPYIEQFNYEAKTFDKVYSFPRGLQYPVAQGEVGAIIEKPHENTGVTARTIHYNGSVPNGSSGGPVVNEYGELVGVTYSGVGDNVAFSIAAEYVKKILE